MSAVCSTVTPPSLVVFYFPGLEASLAEAEAKAKAKKGKMSASKNTTSNDSSASKTTTTDLPASEQDAIEALEKGEDYNAESKHTKHEGKHKKVNKKTKKKKKKKGISKRNSGKKNEQSRDYSWAKVRRLLNHYCHPETHSVNGKGHMFFSGDGPRGILFLFHLLTWKTLSAPSSKRG